MVVGSGSLVAAFGFSPGSPNIGQAVSFDAGASTGNPTLYSWSFGDGGTGTGATASHTYAGAGTFSVTGDVVGTTLYSGRGAGQDATASAVISDIADAAALLKHGKGAHLIGEETTLVPRSLRLAPHKRNP